MTFTDAVRHFENGDFSFMDTVCEGNQIIEWYEEGFFADHPKALAEALACACFNGRIPTAKYLLSKGVKPEEGAMTGMNAFHWAANRGQLEAVRLLIDNKADLEVRNSYGGTVLSCAVWSAIHETKPTHLAILQALIEAGADESLVEIPTGHSEIDHLFTK